MVILPRTSLTVGTSPVVKAIPTDYLARWHFSFKNTASSPGNVTAVRYRRYAIPSSNPGPWETFTLSTPLLAGESAAIRVVPTGHCCTPGTRERQALCRGQ
jgi:hypothetical protein